MVTTVYVANDSSASVTPVGAATDTAGPPFRISGNPYLLAASPDGTTVWVATGAGCRPGLHRHGYGRDADPARPCHGARLQPGREDNLSPHPRRGEHRGPDRRRDRYRRHPDPVAGGYNTGMVITPDGKTLYVADCGDGTVIPVDLATGTAGTAIPVGMAGETGSPWPSPRTAARSTPRGSVPGRHRPD